MCLSNVYRASDRELIMELAAQIRSEQGFVVVRDLFGGAKRIPGAIASVDLENNIVLIQTQEDPAETQAPASL